MVHAIDTLVSSIADTQELPDDFALMVLKAL
jgi:hypothetical protein